MKNWLLFKLLFTGWAILVLAVLTGIFASITLVLAWCGVKDTKNQWAAHAWANSILWFIGCSVRVTGMDNIRDGESYVLASNHTSAVDILALFAVLPDNFRWLAKAELFKIPLFGKAMLAAGYIPLDRSDRRAALLSLKEAARRIAAGASVVIFPEGTRSRDENLLPFKSGGLALAIRSGRPVVPIAISGARDIYPPHGGLLVPGKVKVRIGEQISVDDWPMDERNAFADYTREKVIELLNQEKAENLTTR